MNRTKSIWSGFAVLAALAAVLCAPARAQFPALIPWSSLASVYPAGRWPQGIDQKLLFQETGNATIRQLRLRPGHQTPLIRTAGHTHLFVLQGAGAVTAAGGATLPMKKYDYVMLPENTAAVVANPKEFL